MRATPVHDYAALSTPEREALQANLQPLQTLADVLAWLRSHTPPLTVLEIITQDEYTHDVVVSRLDTHYLVFDTT